MAAKSSKNGEQRRHSYTTMIADERFEPSDAYVAVMGMTGSGKSSMIATCCPNAVADVGHGLESQTTKVEIYTFQLEGRKVHLVDTPGFDDTNRSDTDVLKDLAYWLGLSYEKKGIQLTGLVYLHPINQIRMQGTAFKNLRTFKHLVGSNSMKSVALVSTMWNASTASEDEARYQLLINGENYWKGMIDQGATPYRHTNDRQSAINILSPLLKNEPTILELQHELVDQGKPLNTTKAGIEVDAGMSKHREDLEKKLEDTRDEMGKALAAKDQKLVDQLAADQERYEREVKDTENAREEMKINMEKIFAEKEQQYKKSIDDIEKKLRESQEAQAQREVQYKKDQEAARKFKEEKDQEIAEHQEALGEAQAETFLTRLRMELNELSLRQNKEEESQDEYRKKMAAFRKEKDEHMQNNEKERQRLQIERALLEQRQREHELAMAPPPYQNLNFSQPAAPPPQWAQPSYPPPTQYYDQQANQYAQAAAVGGGMAAVGTMGLMGAATMCTLM